MYEEVRNESGEDGDFMAGGKRVESSHCPTQLRKDADPWTSLKPDSCPHFLSSPPQSILVLAFVVFCSISVVFAGAKQLIIPECARKHMVVKN